MKTRTMQLVFMCAMVSCSTSALAQLVITSADVSARLTPGDTVVTHDDTLLTSANIGSLAGGNAWDFSTLASHTTTIAISQAKPTPFDTAFPGATHVLKTSLSGTVVVPPYTATVRGDLYLYFVVGSSFSNPGTYGNGIATVVLVPGFPPTDIPGTVKIANAPADVFYPLPLTMGATWTSTYVATQTIVLAIPIPVAPTVTNHDISYVVDAYGTMKMPGGGVQQALRVRKVESAGGKTVGYIFLAASGATVQFTASDTLQASTGVIAVRQKTVSWSPGKEVPVPIQLNSFTASWNGSSTILSWSTKSEVNNYGFEIEKSADRAGTFRAVADGFVAGHGTTTVPQKYTWADKSPSAGTWYYRLKQIDLDGAAHYTDAIRLDIVADVHAGTIPATFGLNQNYPNPFNPATLVTYQVAAPGEVKLAVYDLLGREVTVLVNERKEPGSYTVEFDAHGLASGVYLYRMRAGDFVATRQLMVLR